MNQDRLLQITFSGVSKSKTIPYLEMSRIPTGIIDLLSEIGQAQDLGGIQLVTISDGHHYGTVSRMAHFIKSQVRAIRTRPIHHSRS